MEEKINFFEKIARSLNPLFSREVIKWSLGEGFKYLAFLIFLLSLILSLKGTISFHFVAKDLPQKIEIFFLENFGDFPEIEIEKGKVFSSKDPFLKEWDIDKEKAVFVVDTKAKKEDIISGKYSIYPQGLFLLGDEFVIKTVNEEKESIEAHPISKELKFKIVFNPKKDTFAKLKWNHQKFDLTSTTIKKWKNIIALMILPLLAIFLFISNFIGEVFQILIFSIVSLITNKLAKAKLEYKKLLSIGIFSLTGPLILETVVKLLPKMIPGFWIINTLFYLSLLIMGILKVKSGKKSFPRAKGKKLK